MRIFQVISALETLEALAAGNDRENEEILRLSKAVERLEQEKHQRNQQHLKFEEELEQVEKTYRKDIDDLQQMVKSLVNENRNLSTTVSSLPTHNDSPVSSSSEFLDELITEMQLLNKILSLFLSKSFIFTFFDWKKIEK